MRMAKVKCVGRNSRPGEGGLGAILLGGRIAVRVTCRGRGLGAHQSRVLRRRAFDGNRLVHPD